MAIETIWDEYYEQVRNFVNNKTNHHPDAEDIVQTVFIKVHRHMSDMKDEMKLRGWIYQIARNTITDHFRKEMRTDELPEQMESTDENQEADFSEEAIIGMRDVLAYLPDKYREAVELSELKEEAA